MFSKCENAVVVVYIEIIRLGHLNLKSRLWISFRLSSVRRIIQRCIELIIDLEAVDVIHLPIICMWLSSRIKTMVYPYLLGASLGRWDLRLLAKWITQVVLLNATETYKKKTKKKYQNIPKQLPLRLQWNAEFVQTHYSRSFILIWRDI